jgi:hypothetical protein
LSWLDTWGPQQQVLRMRRWMLLLMVMAPQQLLLQLKLELFGAFSFRLLHLHCPTATRLQFLKQTGH